MLENFLFSINSVAPLFLMVLLGYYMRQSGAVGEKEARVLNYLSFTWGLPALLFKEVSASDFGAAFDPTLILLALVAVLILFFASWGIGGRFIHDKKKLGSFVQACYRSNYSIMGTALVANVYGVIEKSALLVATSIPLFTILGVIVLARCGSEDEERLHWGQTALKILKNPLIIGILLGFVVCFTRVQLPTALSKTVNYVAQLATPVSFLAVGTQINLRNVFDKYSVAISAVKLLVAPLVFVPIAILLGIRGEGLLGFYILMAAPTAISSFTLAVNMGCDRDVAANGVFVSTLLSVVTFTLGIYLLKSFNLL